MPSFSIPLSGLTASSEALSTTANNLANLNTIGYKDQQIQFADLFYQNLGTNGAGDPVQQGAGVTVSSKPSDFTEGNVTPTGVSTDVAVSGSGFFVVEKNGVQSYTRAGNFEVGTDNLLKTAEGQQVLGYPAANGVVNTSGGLTTLALGAGTVSPATVTKNVSLTSNLNATAADGSSYTTQANIYDSLGGSHAITFTYTNEDVPAVPAIIGQAATGTLTSSGTAPSDGDQVTIGSTTYTFKTTLTASTTANEVLIGASSTEAFGNLVNAVNNNTLDTNGTGGGGTQDFGTLTTANASVTAVDTTPGTMITLTAKADSSTPITTATPVGTTLTWGGGDLANGVTAVPGVPAIVNKWGYAVTIPAVDLGGAATAPAVSLATGTLLFNGDGTLKSITPTAGSASLTNPTITVPPNGSTFADGANQLNFTWHVVNPDGTGLLTQEAAPNSTASIQQDGASSGTLQNFNIGSDGTITGSFSNGTTAILGQIALASFADNQGLSRTGNNDFSPTLASGQPTIGAPTSGGLGSISGGALEQSNVDIATEFAALIVAQRSYEANARVVTTFDTIAQDTIALKP
jgi:flagellar hook protein FlgE